MEARFYIISCCLTHLSDEFGIVRAFGCMAYDRCEKSTLKQVKSTKDSSVKLLNSKKNNYNRKMKLQNANKSPDVPVADYEWFDLNENVPFEDALELTKCKLVAERIEERLRQAKGLLQCGEVLIPCNLTLRIAKDVLKMSENEPCGLRGCVIYVNLEEKNVSTRLGKVICDSETVSTFEIILTLRKDFSRWLNIKRLLPERLLKKLGQDKEIVISEAYTLCKKKLYRSNNS